MIPHRTLSRDTSENGVSFRVEACRKRLRLIRGNQKGTIETAGVLVAVNVEASTEMSESPGGSESRSERMDEAGIT